MAFNELNYPAPMQVIKGKVCKYSIDDVCAGLTPTDHNNLTESVNALERAVKEIQRILRTAERKGRMRP